VFAYMGAVVTTISETLSILTLPTDYSNSLSKILILWPISKALCKPQAGTHVN
jgi:hypothetical protein